MEREETTKYEINDSISVKFIKAFLEEKPTRRTRIEIEQTHYDGNGLITQINTINIEHQIFEKISELVKENVLQG